MVRYWLRINVAALKFRKLFFVYLVARRDAMQREEEEKRHIYETQEYSRADVERINRNKLQLKGNIELLEGENADFDQQIWEKEIQITKEQEKVQYY